METEIRKQLNQARTYLQNYLSHKPEASIQIAYLSLQVQHYEGLLRSREMAQKFLTR